MKRTVSLLLLLFASAAAAAAQTPDAAARAALSALPESQAVLYLNARRITNEVLPRVVPAAEMQKGVDELKKNVNVDLRAIEFVVVGMRLTTDGPANVVPVEFGIVVKGGFGADALLSFVRMGTQGKYRQESRAGKTVDVFKIDFDPADKKPDGGDQPVPDQSAAGAPKPKNELPSEIAAVALDADSILVGTQGYVFAALDARAGGASVKPVLTDLALRDPNALLSLAADLPPNLSKYLDDAAGKPAADGFLNDEMRRLIDSVRQVQTSLNMTPLQYGLQTILRADTPESARALSGLINLGLNAFEEDARKRAASKRPVTAGEARVLALLRSIQHTTRENEVALGVSVPQATVASFVRENFGPTPKKAATPARRARRPAARRRG